jgi:hypothetical protein
MGDNYNILEDSDITKALVEKLKHCLHCVENETWPWATQPTSPQPPKSVSWHVREHTKVFVSHKLFDVSQYTTQRDNLISYLKSLKEIDRNEKESAYLQCTENNEAVDPMEGTSTSFMTATETTDRAVVPFLDNSGPLYNLLKGVFGQQNSLSSTSYVNSYISARMDGSLQVFSLKEEEQPYQMVLRCWKSSNKKCETTRMLPAYLRQHECTLRGGQPSATARQHYGSERRKRSSVKRGFLLGKPVSSYKDRMYHFIKQNFHVLIDAIVRSKAWLKLEFAYVRTGDSTFRNVSDVINSEFVHMTLKNLYDFWEVTPKYWELEEHRSLGLECYSLQVQKGNKHVFRNTFHQLLQAVGEHK